MSILEILEAMKNVIALMKGKAGDALYFHKDIISGEMYAYLIVDNNYIRYTRDAIIPEFDRFNDQIFLVDVLASLEQVEESQRMMKFSECYIPGKGLLVFGKTSVSDYVADARYRDLMVTVNTVLRYMNDPEGVVSAYRDFQATPQWNTYVNLKASDGAKYVNVDGKYTMYLFSGVVPTVKNDQVNLLILDNPRYSYFMTNFEVTKWKITKKETKRIYTYNCIVCFFKI
jgi:hypothetical protein